MTIEQQLHDGSRAKEILENEQFNASFDAIEQEFVEAWKSSPARDKEGREACWQYLMVLRKVKENLILTLESGKVAQRELQHKQGIIDRLKSGFIF